jgi:phage baseplate assembly protein V
MAATDDLANLLRPFASRLGNMLARGKLAAVNAGGKMQALQLQLLGGEVKDRLEHFEPYGFTSHPNPGSAEAAVAFLDGDRSHGIVLVVADRKYRMSGFAQGEVAIHDDQGQSVHLTRGGIVVKGAGLPMVFQDTPSITFKADTFIRFETPWVQMTQLLQAQQVTYGGVPGGVGAAVATMGGGTVNYSGVSLNYLNSPQASTGATITHDGKNIGSTHTHAKVTRGDDNSAGPNPP